jgi:hypothetical protein
VSVTEEKQGFRARQRAKLRQKIDAAVRGSLEPDEEIDEFVFGQVRPRMFLGLEVLLGPFVVLFAVRYYYLAISARRLFVIEAPKTKTGPGAVDWVESFEGVVVEKYREGILWTLLYFRRRTDESPIRFRSSRTFNARTQKIAGALGALTKP